MFVCLHGLWPSLEDARNICVVYMIVHSECVSSSCRSVLRLQIPVSSLANPDNGACASAHKACRHRWRHYPRSSLWGLRRRHQAKRKEECSPRRGLLCRLDYRACAESNRNQDHVDGLHPAWARSSNPSSGAAAVQRLLYFGSN